MFDVIEAALASDIAGDVLSRARRLVSGGAGDYWSAIAELFVAAALRGCGLEVTLGTPDLVVVDPADHSEVAIELTAVWRTSDSQRLTEIIAGGWTGSSQPSVIVPDQATHISTRLADKILTAMLEADHRLQAGGGPKGEREEVDISSIIEPAKVRAFLAPRSPQFMVSRTGPRSTIVNPWPDLAMKVQDKARQLTGQACGLVAVDGTHIDVSAYAWAEMVKEGRFHPNLEAGPNIAGVTLFWPDLRHHVPFRAIFVRNSRSVGPDPSALTRALECLGTSRQRVMIKPSAEDLQRMFSSAEGDDTLGADGL